MYLKLNEKTLKKQGSYKEEAGFLLTPKNGKEKHMTHPTLKCQHSGGELKKLDDESTDKTKKNRNPWILKEEPEDPQIICKIVGRVMEVNTISLFGNFANEFGGNNYHQQIERPTGTQASTIAEFVLMEEIMEKGEDEADTPESAVHNIGDKVYVDDGRGWWFVFCPGTRYKDGKFMLKTDVSTLEED